MVTKEDYQRSLNKVSMNKSKFVQVRGDLSGHSLLEKLFDDLFIYYEVKHLFIVKPTFEKYTEVD